MTVLFLHTVKRYQEIVKCLNYKESNLGFSVVEKCSYFEETGQCQSYRPLVEGDLDGLFHSGRPAISMSRKSSNELLIGALDLNSGNTT